MIVVGGATNAISFLQTRASGGCASRSIRGRGRRWQCRFCIIQRRRSAVRIFAQCVFFWCWKPLLSPSIPSNSPDVSTYSCSLQTGLSGCAFSASLEDVVQKMYMPPLNNFLHENQQNVPFPAAQNNADGTIRRVSMSSIRLHLAVLFRLPRSFVFGKIVPRRSF